MLRVDKTSFLLAVVIVFQLWTELHRVPCSCSVTPLPSPSNASALSHVAPTGTLYCPPVVGIATSSFLSADVTVPLGGGANLCGDAVIYGYDVMYERLGLFTRTTFLGVPTQQDPPDALALAEVLWKDRPHVVIELGTYSGAGALWIAAIMHLGASPTGRVITIDPADIKNAPQPLMCTSGAYPCRSAYEEPLFRERVTVITGKPDAAATLIRVRALLNEARVAAAPEPLRVAVIEDSRHYYDMVLSNVVEYAGFVTPGMLLQVQDTKMTRILGSEDGTCRGGEYGRPGACGPLDAVSAFLASSAGEDFVVDRVPEAAAIYSQHAGGWLRRRETAAASS